MILFKTGFTVGLAALVMGCGNHTAASSSGSSQTMGRSSAAPPAARPASSASPSAAPSPAAPAKVTSPAPTGTATEAPSQAGVNTVGAATKAFIDRIRQYVEFHNNVEKMVPALTETSDPAKIAARQKALGETLIKQRPDAKQGDFFIKEYQPILRKIIHDDFAKRSAADRKALIVELPKGIKLDVNSIYPTTLPLATAPANLLKALPELPPELEYRIVGRDLVLRDVTGNVVVDIMPNVFPVSS